MSVFVKDSGLLFVHIPKTGGTSITEWLLARGGVYSDGYTHTALQHTSHDLASVWSFCVVRNPWDRMVSMYHFVRKVNSDFSAVSFDEWLRTGLNYKRHWYSVTTPQLDWIKVRPNAIMRFENLANDFAQVQMLMQDHTPLPVINATQHEPYQNYYSDWSRQLIQDLFYTDITQFGYTF